MSLQDTVSLVAKIELPSNTYTVTDRMALTIDGVTYDNVVLSWGKAEYYGNLGNEESRISDFDMILNNGEEFVSSGYLFNPTDVWNNSTVTVKRWDLSLSTFASCESFLKGIIKNYRIEQDKIRFTVDVSDRKDELMLPAVLCVDQTGLTDAEALEKFDINIDSNTITSSGNSFAVFSKNELVKLTHGTTGTIEYQRVSSITVLGSGRGYIIFKEDLIYDYVIGTPNLHTVEKIFRNLPDFFIGKTLPIQIGELDDTTNGIFAKTITISDKIGQQTILIDNIELSQINHIGVWESALERYFEARKSSVAGDNGEYTINENNILFSVNTSTTLAFDITSTTEGNDIITVDDYTKIIWQNETDLPSWKTYPELITANVLGIGSELMLILERPSSNNVQVERGYSGTEITTHGAGDVINQAAKYSAKNLLTFTEKFVGKILTNQYYGNESSSTPGVTWLPSVSPDLINVDINGTGKTSNLNDDNINTYMEMTASATDTNFSQEYVFFNYDIQFPKIEIDINIMGAYHAVKIDYDMTIPSMSVLENGFMRLLLYDPDEDTLPDEPAKTFLSTPTRDNVSDIWEDVAGTYTESINSFSTIDRDDYELISFNLTKLEELNKKWKYQLQFQAWGTVSTSKTWIFSTKLYALGIWFDMFLDYTTNIIISSLKGREITADVNTITSGSTGDLCENPVDVLALLLTQEIGYSTSDFTSNWSNVREYVNDSGNYEIISPSEPTPETAFSYGVDDKRMKGWGFCSKLASHFNLQIVKNYEGKIDIVNLHDIYNENVVSTTEYVFCLAGTYLEIIKATTPTAPVHVGKYDIGTGINDLCILGNYCYIVGSSKLYILDVSNPSEPKLIYTMNDGDDGVELTNCQRIGPYDNKIYIAGGGTNAGYIQIIDVTIPSSPTIKGYLSNIYAGNADGVVLKYYSGSGKLYMFVCGHYNGSPFSTDYGTLVNYDVTDYDNPVRDDLKVWSGCTNFFGPVIVDNFAYIADFGQNYHRCYSIANPANITELGSLRSSPTTMRTIAANENYAFPLKNHQLYSTDFTVKGSPSNIDIVNDGAEGGLVEFNTPKHAIADGDEIYVAGSTSDSLWIGNISDPSAIVHQGKIKDGDGGAYLNGVKRIALGDIGVDLSYEIKIDDIRFLKDNGNRKIIVRQTGTDLLYNDIIVNYKRNNSTDKYQDTYVLPETYTLSKSGDTLSTARENYFDGEKRTLIIDSPFIYTLAEARRLAEWKADDQAEVHFYVELFIDYDHYTDINSLSNQYKIGDIIYLTGEHAGIAFDSDRKFYIQNVFFPDAYEMEIHMKSVDPVALFSTS